MVDLSCRATEPEELDLGVSEAEALGSLADLRFVNQWLGGWTTLAAAVRPYAAGRPGTRLLDVGSGSADLPALLERTFPGLLAVAVDLKPLHLRQAPAALRRAAADVRDLPFRDGSFDLVTASLFLHHFDAGQLPEVLHALARVARGAVIVNDLRRSAIPFLFGRVAFPLLFRSRVTVADALLSIRRGFTPGELRAGFVEAGLPQVRIRSAWPYRLVAVAELDHG